jgi:hypothetical protein
MRKSKVPISRQAKAMTKKVKLAILRARHDQNAGSISDQACIEMMMVSPSHLSVFDYWSYNTDGYLDFLDSTMFPWVDIVIESTDIVNGYVDRNIQLKKAYEATKALNGGRELIGFDGFIAIIFPGGISTIPDPNASPGQPRTITFQFDGGAGGRLVGKAACALPVMPFDHTFMCHEVGHVLGFGHTYGVWNNGTDWDAMAPWFQEQVYGDPYDIMSSASFGTRVDPSLTTYTGSPQFTAPTPSGWPVNPSIGMGPAPARAHVHLWDPSAYKPGSIRELVAPIAGTHTARLYAAWSGQDIVRLIIVRPTNEDAQGRGRCYIEYRDTKAWDAGLHTTGRDLARRAVVVHTLANAPSDGVRCWYRGQIIVPVEIDSDLAISGTPLTVKVKSSNLERRYVDIEISIFAAPGIDISVTADDEIVRPAGPLKEKETPCGDVLRWGTWATQSEFVYRAITYGLGGEGTPGGAPPRLRWTVGSTPVPDGTGSLTVAVSGATFTIGYSVHSVTSDLSLTSQPGDKFSVGVAVTATDSAGISATAASSFDPQGYYVGYTSEDWARLISCENEFLLSLRFGLKDFEVPDGPDPFPAWLRGEIEQLRLNDLVSRIAESHPEQADALKRIGDLRKDHLARRLPQLSKRMFNEAPEGPVHLSKPLDR